MSKRSDTSDYRALFLSPTPMMDMRAPAEFMRGAFPSALSLPLMSDDERAQVGICYKQRGQSAAISLGHQLVSGDLKAQRLAHWKAFIQQHPQGYLYCFRGGLRSQTVQQWLREEGINYPLIIGGFKAMRRFLLDELERVASSAPFVLISGKTGTGKTRVITRLTRAVDLEGLANHRGSSFGQLPTPQPSQIDFENTIIISLMRILANGTGPIFLEDEGRLIGCLALPGLLLEKMATAPIVVVEQSLNDRVEVVIEDYVLDLGRRYAELYEEDGPRLHAEKLQGDLLRIRKRLGGQQHQNVSAMMAEAFAQQRLDADLAAHRHWITVLLEKYYDPMYEYQLSKRAGTQLFSGDRQAVIAWAQQGG
ncbi:MAG: tRNA 2-selenouridine(34) synthase MnmH [Halioglobus sp.]|nr:tRNA 2-selenouridine(34) synthase MnmH [Halioglobus sp.]